MSYAKLAKITVSCKKKLITMIFTSKEVEDLAKHVPICCNLSHEMLEQLERGYWQNV